MFTKIKRSFRWLLRKRTRDSGLLFTRDNVRIDRDIEYYENEVCAYIEVWFDAGLKFGLKLSGDEYVNVYAYIKPNTGDVRVTYVIYYADGFIDDERNFKRLTVGEKHFISEMVNEVSLKETGMSVKENWDYSNDAQNQPGYDFSWG